MGDLKANKVSQARRRCLLPTERPITTALRRSSITNTCHTLLKKHKLVYKDRVVWKDFTLTFSLCINPANGTTQETMWRCHRCLSPDSKLEIRRYNRQSVGPAGRPQTTIIYDETQEISTLQVSIDDQYPTQGHLRLIASALGAAKPMARSYALNTM